MESKAFISAVKDKAQEDMKKHGILASLTIAQAIVESAWGDSQLTKEANNLFGIKADSNWKGLKVLMKTKEYRDDGTSYETEAWFKKYKSWAESIADHTSLLLKPRYSNIVGQTDYKTVCILVKQDGYATDSGYSNLLIRIIEQNKLYEVDGIKGDSTDTSNVVKSLQHKLNILKIKDKNNDSLAEDGVNGPLTKSAVMNLQSIVGIVPDGEANTSTNGVIGQILSRPYLKKGSKGAVVRYIQWRVGATIDGDFGEKTEKKIRSYQKSNNCYVDGIVGSVTWNKLLA